MNIETVGQLEEIKPVFLFIPDISGFTKFINSTDLSESKQFVHDLLETIVDSNILNLKIAEILGDAIVFYSVGTPPNITKLESQVKKTFCDFQKKVRYLENQENSPKQLHGLTLKIIVHFGEIATTEIKGINKLIGSDLILAYRMLKNTIREDEYLLITDQYIQTQEKGHLEKSFLWSEIKESSDYYESFGEIHYNYVLLSPLDLPMKVAKV